MNARWALRLTIILLTSLLIISAAHAGPAGKVTHVSGPLAARKSDGKVKALSINSIVESGDTLITEKRTYARIKFYDNSEITLKPNTQFKVEEYSFNREKPSEDKSVYNLVKGGLRAVSGQIGKRGDPDRFRMKTPVATIGIRGTIFTADYVEETPPQTGELANPVLLAMADIPAMSDAAPLVLAQADGLAPGLYLHVIDGMVNLSNQGGMKSFTTGQFGHAPNFHQPPMRLPANPGIQFTPPTSFTPPPPGPGGTRPTTRDSSGSKDCEVR